MELVLTAQNAKVSVSAELQSEFVREFTNESPELIERVFRAWRRRSKFMPTISEIFDLLEEEAVARYQEREGERRATLKAEVDAARENWEDPEQREWLAEQAKQLADKLSISPPVMARRRFLMSVRPSPASPGVVMNEEEISKRRDHERKEIREYLNDAA